MDIQGTPIPRSKYLKGQHGELMKFIPDRWRSIWVPNISGKLLVNVSFKF